MSWLPFPQIPNWTLTLMGVLMIIGALVIVIAGCAGLWWLFSHLIWVP